MKTLASRPGSPSFRPRKAESKKAATLNKAKIGKFLKTSCWSTQATLMYALADLGPQKRSFEETTETAKDGAGAVEERERPHQTYHQIFKSKLTGVREQNINRVKQASLQFV